MFGISRCKIDSTISVQYHRNTEKQVEISEKCNFFAFCPLLSINAPEFLAIEYVLLEILAFIQNAIIYQDRSHAEFLPMASRQTFFYNLVNFESLQIGNQLRLHDGIDIQILSTRPTFKITTKEVQLAEPDYEYLFSILLLLIKLCSKFHSALTSAFIV